MNRAKRLLLPLLLLPAFFISSLRGETVELPAPQQTQGMPLFEALSKRATVRSFDLKELSLQQLSSLLWASFGINRPDGKRTAPSALNKQEIDLYVLLNKGAYLYNAISNQLDLVTTADLRKLSGTQNFFTNAPIALVLVADLSKMDGTNTVAKLNTTYLNAGYISQNIYLFCASENLATGARLGVDRKTLGSRLSLGSNHAIILAHSVGYLGR
jgi:nitroreductase